MEGIDGRGRSGETFVVVEQVVKVEERVINLIRVHETKANKRSARESKYSCLTSCRKQRYRIPK